MNAATQDVRTRTESLVRLEAALVTPELADRMEVAVWSPEPDLYRAASIDGSVGFRRTDVHGRWSYQVVEEYDDTYWSVFRDLEEHVRGRLMAGRRHIFEAEMKEDRRSHGLRHHEAVPDDSGPQSPPR